MQNSLPSIRLVSVYLSAQDCTSGETTDLYSQILLATDRRGMAVVLFEVQV